MLIPTFLHICVYIFFFSSFGLDEGNTTFLKVMQKDHILWNFLCKSFLYNVLKSFYVYKYLTLVFTSVLQAHDYSLDSIPMLNLLHTLKHLHYMKWKTHYLIFVKRSYDHLLLLSSPILSSSNTYINGSNNLQLVVWSMFFSGINCIRETNNPHYFSCL